MRLFIEGKKTDDPNEMFVDAGFIVRALKSDEADHLKKLKSGVLFYPYINEDGDISHVGCIFRSDPVGDEVTNQAAFRSASQFAFVIDTVKSVFGTNEQQAMHEETMKLKGSRLFPAYLEIKKTQITEKDGVPYAYISGKFCRVRDKRLDFLAPNEATAFGSGTFTLDKVKAACNGRFVVFNISPYAKKIEEIVKEQVKAFENYSELYGDSEADDERKKWAAKIEYTKKLLKPHAHEIFKYADNKIFYVNSFGQWQFENVPSLRSLDAIDRQRIYKKLEDEGRLSTNFRNARADLHKASTYDKFHIGTLLPALQPHVVESAKEDKEEIDNKLKRLKTLTPFNGPLGEKDLPGLRKGVSLFPHQSLILAALKDGERMLIDADPGAGKTLVIICDILQQMKAGKLKRPLVLMPENLLAQFAQEVIKFSELNPWIISTNSVKRWKEGSLPEFIEDAKKTPPNTVFLTSYEWISLRYNEVENGEVERINEAGDTQTVQYKTDKDFFRTRVLLNELKIDGLYQDECHLLRGDSNKAHAAVNLASNVSVIRGLTGTVMPGDPYDVTGPMSVIHSGVFGTEREFRDAYNIQGDRHKYKPGAPKLIRKKLQGFGMVSVRRTAWAHLMPKMHKEYHYIAFNKDQQDAYNSLLGGVLDDIRKNEHLSALLKKFEADIATDAEMGNLLERFIPLDVFLNSPASAKDFLQATMLGDNAVSPKSKIINDIIRKHLANPEAGKVLVFGSFKSGSANLLDNLATDLKPIADYYEGGMVDVLNRFKNPEDPLKILFGVDKTLIVGQNIQSANCVIHSDLKWLPGDIDQRESRVNRIGQLRDVYVHYILAKGSAEILKAARIMSKEHLIAKANSDFMDSAMLQPIQMTYDNMTSVHQAEQLTPYIQRRETIEKHYESRAEKEKDIYGPTMLKPRGYTEISSVMKDSKTLKKVPSSKDFVGDSQDHEAIVEKELNEMPDDPKHPKKIKFGLAQKDGSWFIYAYRAADPSGFLRQLGFKLQLGHYYVELISKGEVDNLVKRIEEKLSITNLLDFEHQVRETKVIERGMKKGLKKKSQKARSAITSAEEEKPEIELHFSTFDGAPVVWVKNVFSEDDKQVPLLKRLGFEFEPQYWEKKITRSTLEALLKRIQTNYPQVRIVEWDEFKGEANRIFKGLSLDEFDPLAAK